LSNGDLTAVPDEAILYLPNDVEAEFEGELGKVAGTIDAASEIPGHPQW
jgi:hypothetical protein